MYVESFSGISSIYTSPPNLQIHHPSSIKPQTQTSTPSNTSTPQDFKLQTLLSTPQNLPHPSQPPSQPLKMQFSHLLITAMTLLTTTAIPLEAREAWGPMKPGEPCPYLPPSVYQYCCFDSIQGPGEPACLQHFRHGDCCPP
ncbi:hypothetical protein HYFRA_00010146 [Hymenoscyphus fraxineus]|uniref:Uncharacterized protein n=1 Tax=Hymenoscyphus fraxineus TaxID=746836 RepID=A0A9N9KVJ1_9HELO|nr:hypothetical protein HYFRA_00010146 [Hymenoscyphus fraxineus]